VLIVLSVLPGVTNCDYFGIKTLIMHVIFAFVFDRNFEILILWISGRDCRVTTAIVSSSN